MPIDKKEILVMTIAASCENGLSPIQLQKSLFLITKSALPGLPEDIYQFVPYNYGPFCQDIYTDIESLINRGLIVTNNSGFGWDRYVITPFGLIQSKEIEKRLDTRFTEYVHSIVDWVRSLSFVELLRSVYAKYPEYSVNSIFRE